MMDIKMGLLYLTNKKKNLRHDKWNARVVGVDKGRPAIEIRKTMGAYRDYAQVLILVGGHNGYEYRGSGWASCVKSRISAPWAVRISTNGAFAMSEFDFKTLHNAINEAKSLLKLYNPDISYGE